MSDIEDILSDLSKTVGEGGFDPASYEDALNKIHAGGLHNEAMNSLLRDMLKSIDGVDIFTSGTFLELASSSGIGLVLIRYSGLTRYIYSSPVAFSQKVLSQGSCCANTYRLLGPDPLEDVFDPDREITLDRSTKVIRGDLVSKDHRDIIDLTDFEQLPTITLRLTTSPSGNYEWAFDRRTLKAFRYSTLLLTESNLCGIFDLLSEVGDEQTEDFLDRYTSHKYHFVRWKAVQSLAALNPKRALEAVTKLTDDRHPDIREAAQATLATGVLEGD